MGFANNVIPAWMLVDYLDYLKKEEKDREMDQISEQMAEANTDVINIIDDTGWTTPEQLEAAARDNPDACEVVFTQDDDVVYSTDAPDQAVRDTMNG